MNFKKITSILSLLSLAFILCSATRHLQTSVDKKANTFSLKFKDQKIKIKLNSPGVSLNKDSEGYLETLSFSILDSFYQVYFYPGINYNHERIRVLKEYKMVNNEPILNGSSYSFSNEGHIISESHWKRGVMHGKQYLYNDKEQVIEEKEYCDGFPIGVWKLYHYSGVIAAETTFPPDKESWIATQPKIPPYQIESNKNSLASLSVHTSRVATEVWYNEKGEQQGENRYKVYHNGKNIVMEKIP